MGGDGLRVRGERRLRVAGGEGDVAQVGHRAQQRRRRAGGELEPAAPRLGLAAGDQDPPGDGLEQRRAARRRREDRVLGRLERPLRLGERPARGERAVASPVGRGQGGEERLRLRVLVVGREDRRHLGRERRDGGIALPALARGEQHLERLAERGPGVAREPDARAVGGLERGGGGLPLVDDPVHAPRPAAGEQETTSSATNRLRCRKEGCSLSTSFIAFALSSCSYCSAAFAASTREVIIVFGPGLFCRAAWGAWSSGPPGMKSRADGALGGARRRGGGAGVVAGTLPAAGSGGGRGLPSAPVTSWMTLSAAGATSPSPDGGAGGAASGASRGAPAMGR